MFQLNLDDKGIHLEHLEMSGTNTYKKSGQTSFTPHMCMCVCVYVCVCVCACVRVRAHARACMCLVVSVSLGIHGLQPSRLLCPWDFPGKNTGVGCYRLLQGIFLTQGSHPCFMQLLHWQGDSLPTAPHGKTYFDPPKSFTKGKVNLSKCFNTFSFSSGETDQRPVYIHPLF